MCLRDLDQNNVSIIFPFWITFQRVHCCSTWKIEVSCLYGVVQKKVVTQKLFLDWIYLINKAILFLAKILKHKII